jgi:transposase
MAKGHLPYDIDQRLLLPPDIRCWLPEGHLALFILDVIAELDLSKVHAVHAAKDARGRAGYHPAMMAALLIDAYCMGKSSSRFIERATHEDVAFRVISGDQHPDHDCIAAFRKEHLEALAGAVQASPAALPESGLVTNLLVPPSRQKHGALPDPGSAAPAASVAQRMRHKLASGEAQALYKMRKAIVEPVFGQIKEARGLRRLLLRGFAAAHAEFLLIALSHNLLKLFRSRLVPVALTA